VTASETQGHATPVGRAHRRVVFDDGDRRVEFLIWGEPIGEGDVGGVPGHISIVGELNSGRALVLTEKHVRMLLETMLEVKV